MSDRVCYMNEKFDSFRDSIAFMFDGMGIHYEEFARLAMRYGEGFRLPMAEHNGHGHHMSLLPSYFSEQAKKEIVYSVEPSYPFGSQPTPELKVAVLNTAKTHWYDNWDTTFGGRPRVVVVSLDNRHTLLAISSDIARVLDTGNSASLMSMHLFGSLLKNEYMIELFLNSPDADDLNASLCELISLSSL